MKIIKFEAENIKGLRAVEITPDGSMVQITGRNGQGKSSILDAIKWALEGKSAIDPKPIRDGETEARVSLDLGDIVVKRKFKIVEDKEYTTSVVVESADGARYQSPQVMLDKLMDAISFDPLEFCNLPAKAQYDQLSAMAGIDLADDEAAIAADFDARTVANREAKDKRSAADEIKFEILPPDERVSVADLMSKLAMGSKSNLEIDELAAQRETQAVKADQWDHRAEDVLAEILDKKQRITRIKGEITLSKAIVKNATEEAGRLRVLLKATADLPVKFDAAPVHDEISGAEALNSAFDAKERKGALLVAAEAQNEKSLALSDAIDAKRAAIKIRIEKADMPVDGLGLENGTVTLDGIPIEQISDAQKLDLSTAIAMKANAKLRVIRIKNGSLLDEDRLAKMAELAETEDYQIWIERVDSSGKVGIVIEDGMIKGDSGLVGITGAPGAAGDDGDPIRPRDSTWSEGGWR